MKYFSFIGSAEEYEDPPVLVFSAPDYFEFSVAKMKEFWDIFELKTRFPKPFGHLQIEAQWYNGDWFPGDANTLLFEDNGMTEKFINWLDETQDVHLLWLLPI